MRSETIFLTPKVKTLSRDSLEDDFQSQIKEARGNDGPGRLILSGTQKLFSCLRPGRRHLQWSEREEVRRTQMRKACRTAGLSEKFAVVRSDSVFTFLTSPRFPSITYLHLEFFAATIDHLSPLVAAEIPDVAGASMRYRLTDVDQCLFLHALSPFPKKGK